MQSVMLLIGEMSNAISLNPQGGQRPPNPLSSFQCQFLVGRAKLKYLAIALLASYWDNSKQNKKSDRATN
jgi:hypothetical protein